MELEKALKRLLIKNPFYGLFCMSLPKEETRKIPTLAICKRGINCCLLVNPDFWEKHTDDEQISLLLHELGHVALRHMFMNDYFDDHDTLNVANDMEVNSYIENLPKNACVASLLSLENGLGSKEYYKKLKELQQQQEQKAKAQSPNNPCNGGSGGNEGEDNKDKESEDSGNPEGSGGDKEEEKDENKEEKKDKSQKPNEDDDKENDDKEESDGYPDYLPDNINPIDTHVTWDEFKDLPEATQQLMVNNIQKVLVETAEQVEKSCGRIPANLISDINELRKKKPEIFNWKAYFRRLLGTIYDVNIKLTRRKESKRFNGAAGVQHRKKVSIAVAVDTSGSVSDKELIDFFAEIDNIYKAGARITLIECDTQINSIVEYDGKKIPKIHGRGGTYFDPPVNWYKEHKRDYASLIYFTDGYAELPKEKPSGMIWVITSSGLRQDYPGKTIYIPKENADG